MTEAVVRRCRISDDRTIERSGGSGIRAYKSTGVDMDSNSSFGAGRCPVSGADCSVQKSGEINYNQSSGSVTNNKTTCEQGDYAAFFNKSQLNCTLLGDVRRLHAEHHGRYGSPRMHAALRAESGTASRGRVERLMRRHGIRVLAGRRFRPCTTDGRHYLPVAPNVLKQEFAPAAPNRVWLADITYIPTGERWLYLAAVLDLATRKIVGWSMREHMRTELPLAAPMMAAQRQRPAKGLICHSDRGSRYASEANI